MTHTRVWKIDIDQHGWQHGLAQAAAQLAAGEQIAFPTETVYGLGGDATNDKAVRGIFAAKGRPADNPLIVHIYERKQLEQFVAAVHPLAAQLMDAFWPGPLTIILPVKDNTLSRYVTAGLRTVGVRMPDHPVALELMRQSGVPIAAPSANTSGRPSPTTAAHVQQDLQGKIAGIVDGGATGVGLESTVIELVNDNTIAVLRPGGVTLEQLRATCPQATIIAEGNEEVEQAPRAPGMKYTHYAPQGKLTIVKGQADAVAGFIKEQLAGSAGAGRSGVLCFEQHIHFYEEADLVISLGSANDLKEAAARLYDALRQFDEHHIEHIWSEASEAAGLGAALMNRLTKAAGYHIIELEQN